MLRMAKAGTREADPAIIAAGYLAKRTRGFGRWKKRWWQLSDDGTLLYFKSEDRTKALGEIDVARSCYEVKLGGDQCKVDFPRIIPPRCCFSFSVLKRTYYLYAATPGDAKHWAKTIEKVSVVLNYRKKNSSRPEPYLQPVSSSPGEETRQNNPGQVDESRLYSVPHRPHASASDDVSQKKLSAATELEATDQPTPLPQISKPTVDKGNIYSNVQELPETRYGSVPDLHSSRPPQRFHANPHGHRYLSHPTHSRMWLDGSPPPDAYKGRKYGTNPRDRHAFSASRTPHSSYHTGSLDRLRLNQPATRNLGDKARAHHTGREEPQKIRVHRPVDMDGYDLPPRPQSVDISERGVQFSAPKFGVPILPFLSDNRARSRSASAIKSGTAPPAVKPKPILKKTSYTPTLPPDDSAAGSGKGVACISLPPPDAIPPEIPPKRYSVKVQVDSLSGQRDVFLPPPPDFKPPPPPGTSSATPTTSESKIRPSSYAASSQTNTQNGLHQHRSRPDSASSYLQEVHRACIYTQSMPCSCTYMYVLAPGYIQSHVPQCGCKRLNCSCMSTHYEDHFVFYSCQW